MRILKDSDLVKLVTEDKQLIDNLPQPPALPSPPGMIYPDPWYGPKSPIQAASVDLHVGSIFLPQVQPWEHGSTKKPLKSCVLELGHTVVILTKENLDIPADIGAFGFPPSRLSSRGLLMTNPGHVDPGFKGQLRFTVMNIGHEPIALREDDSIVSLLFFKLDSPVKADYAQRNNLTAPAKGPTQAAINCLSKDFLDVSSRADAAAQKAVSSAEFRAKLWGAIVPAMAAVATIIVGVIGVWIPVTKLQTELDHVTKVLEMKESTSRLDKERLEKRLDRLELTKKP